MRIIAGLLVVLMVSTGCSSAVPRGKQLAALPLVDALSKKEVMDYYKDDMEIRSMTTKLPLKNRDEVVEFRDILPEEMLDVERELLNIERLLSTDTYSEQDSLSPQMYAYIKALVDDKVLFREGFGFTGASQEFYVVDVKYNLKFKGEGSLKEDAKYIGVHGAFISDTMGNTYKDDMYISKLEAAVTAEIEAEKQRAKNGKIGIDEIQSRAREADGEVAQITTDVEVVDPESGDVTIVQETIEAPQDLNIVVYNNILGSAIKTTSMIPQLDLVFTPSAAAGNVSGYGIYPQGGSELKEFGINRDDLSGTAEIRFVFRSEIGDSSTMALENVYVKDMYINGIPDFSEDKSIFPQFAEEAIKVTIDNADRARVNNDITAMASGEVYDDVRTAIYFGQMNKDVDIYRSISQVEEFLRRVDTNWLIRIKTYQMEHAKFANTGFGSWQDTYLVSLKQKNDKFVVSDFMLESREMISDVPLSSASSTFKRYTYLSLYGTISAEDKASIRNFYAEFMGSVAERDWDAMYAVFNKDVSMLSKTRRDYLYFMYRGWINRRGSDQKVQYHGAISEWLGGSERQAEFMTTEIAYYEDLGNAQLATNYYLVSKFDDSWVVDEIRNMEMVDIENSNEIKDKIQEIGLYNKKGEADSAGVYNAEVSTEAEAEVQAE